jgi:hypothetical protein
MRHYLYNSTFLLITNATYKGEDQVMGLGKESVARLLNKFCFGNESGEKGEVAPIFD